MKKLLFALLLLTFCNISLFAQSDPYGIIDTVLVGNTEVPLGSSFKIPVTLFNDEELSAFSIPLQYSQEIIEFDSVSYKYSRAIIWSNLLVKHVPETGSILLGGISFSEGKMPAGRGLIAELYFHTAPGASVGQIAEIDSGFVMPAGSFVLTSFEATPINPAFVSGDVQINNSDQAPVFIPLYNLTMNEGDSLVFNISASDPEGEDIKLSAIHLPKGAEFTENGNGLGTFRWQVPYIGPGSCSSSPYKMTFIANDGGLTAVQNVPLEIINVNRLPILGLPDTLIASSGDSVYLPLFASDPDYEQISYEVHNLPGNADYGKVNPGFLSWATELADSGNYQLTVTATDESGGSQSHQLLLTLLPSKPVDLTISQEQAFGNELVDVSIDLTNRQEISGFKLLVEYDVTVLQLVSINNNASRIVDWEKFETETDNGKIWIDANVDLEGSGEPALPLGSGNVATMRFVTSGDPGFAGYHSRIDFIFIDSSSNEDNVVIDPDGGILNYAQIKYRSGGVLLKAFDYLVGDLNLNDVPFEIGDLVYYSNYFVDPINFPLDGVRWYNSDINQDGNPGTLGDLLLMIQIVNGGNNKINNLDQTSGDLSYNLTSNKSDDIYSIKLESSKEIAAVLFNLNLSEIDKVNFEKAEYLENIEMLSHRDNDNLRILLYSPEGKSFVADGSEVINIEGIDNFELLEEYVIDTYGNNLFKTEINSDLVLPLNYELNQNYPNPFNPSTKISFALPSASKIQLIVFNVLGQEVRELANELLPAGIHTILFDGKDTQGEVLPSGVYFYKLISDNFNDTRKMLLLK